MLPEPTAATESPLSIRLEPSETPPLIGLDREAPFDRVRADMQSALAPQAGDWRGAEVHLDLGARELDLFDLRRLVHLLKESFEIDVVGMRCEASSLHRFAERELKVRIHLDPRAELEAPAPAPEASDVERDDTAELPVEELAATGSDEPQAEERGLRAPAPDVPISEEPGDSIHVIRRTLRSGVVLRHAGDVMLYGDVNPGAELYAGGSITVLGALKGLAHAGTHSGDAAWIMSLDLHPTQLRIGQRICISSRDEQSTGRRSGLPRIALVRGGEIVVEPYRGRLPRPEPARSGA